MSEKITYLSSPYSHPEASTREDRFYAALEASAFLMNSGMVVFSPISHSHSIQAHMTGLDEPLPEGWDFWKKQDFSILHRCDELCVLTLDGWRESVGVTDEIAYMAMAGKPIWYLDPLPGGSYVISGRAMEAER